MTDHPVTPPQELLLDWDNLPLSTFEIFVIAAQWGADQELDACCEWIPKATPWDAEQLRAARRPKPSSLKQQALQELDKVNMLWATEEFGKDTLNSLDTIRKALEALPDD